MPRSEWPLFPQTDGEEDTSAMLHCFASTDKQEYYAMICMPKYKNRSLARNIGTLVHEITHLFRKIKEYMGERDPSLEFEAYAMQHLTQAVVAAYYE